MPTHKHKGHLGWGIFLIVLGMIIFLNNMDISIWDSVARLWPVVLIVWGAWKLYYGLKEHKKGTEDIQE